LAKKLAREKGKIVVDSKAQKFKKNKKLFKYSSLGLSQNIPPW
jgi:hypothetical protein